jgi:hypothetical protein
MMVQDVAVRNLADGANPTEQAIWHTGSAFPRRLYQHLWRHSPPGRCLPWPERAQIGSRLVISLQRATQKKKENEQNARHHQDRDEGGN